LNGKNTVRKSIDLQDVAGDEKPGKNVLPGRSEFPRPLFREDDFRFRPHLVQHGVMKFVGLLLP
jgi:hypothetical protein